MIMMSFIVIVMIIMFRDCHLYVDNVIIFLTPSQPSSIAKLASESEDKTIDSVKKGIHAGFLRLDESMRQMPEVGLLELLYLIFFFLYFTKFIFLYFTKLK